MIQGPDEKEAKVLNFRKGKCIHDLIAAFQYRKGAIGLLGMDFSLGAVEI